MSSVVNIMVSPLSQVFLQHLPSLSQLQNFPELWLGILDFMDKFLHLDNSDLLVSKAPFSECCDNFPLGIVFV